MISARIIADSKNQFGNRLTTFVLNYPRIIHSEFMTHRTISRNSASSRAIPFPKMLKSVEDNPFIPLRWQKEHTGMQGTEYFTDNDLIQEALNVHTPAPKYFERIWLEARDAACIKACHLHNNKLTKQLVNRLLEPYMYHTIIATASEWSNFFALRAHPDGEIHIQDLAYKMLEVYNASIPKLLKAGEWHIPFGDNIHDPRIFKILYDEFGRDRFESGTDNPVLQPDFSKAFWDIKIKVSTARCARISYNNFEGKDDYVVDIKLYDRLLSSGHMSPMEHCAYAMTEFEYDDQIGPWCGNFKGFVQLRKTISGENKSDPRVITK